jgi:hypothetical protein
MMERVMDQRSDDRAEIVIEGLADSLTDEVEGKLRTEIEACPDVAFAHLCQVTVAGTQPEPQASLFVWLLPEAVGSLRAALNLVSEAVARALPEDRFLDVLILNSAPELLAQVEEADCLFVERDPAERLRAREAARSPSEAEGGRSRPTIWPW